MKTTLSRLLPISVLCAAITPHAHAQVYTLPITRSASYHYDYGVNNAGGVLDLRGSVTRWSFEGVNTHTAQGIASAQLRFFGKTYEAVAIEGTGRVADGTLLNLGGQWFKKGSATNGSANVAVRIAGFTVFNETSLETKLWSKTFGPYDLLPSPARADFTVGPVPVTVACNAGIGGGLGIGAGLDLSMLTATLTGTANGYAYGWASCGVGNSMASAGVQSTMKFANTTARYDLTAAFSGLTGKLTVTVVPITLIMQLYAELLGKRYTKDVYEWSSPSIVREFPVQ